MRIYEHKELTPCRADERGQRVNEACDYGADSNRAGGRETILAVSGKLLSRRVNIFIKFQQGGRDPPLKMLNKLF